jgi:hypothetical protein
LPDACVLKVRPRPAAGGCCEPAGQRPLAQGESRGELANRERISEVEIDVLLDLVNDHVVVRPFAPEGDVRPLAGPVAIDQQDLGPQVGAFVPGESLDQVQNQVQEGGRPA